MIAGTANQPAASKLKEQEDDRSRAGVEIRFLDGLDHAREFTKIDKVLPEGLEFLHILQSR